MKLSYEQALHRAAAYCGKAERCQSDVRKKLTDWELPEEEQNRLIRHLEKEKFLDEERFVRAFVNDKSKFSRWGKYKIAFELKKKHISQDLIHKYLDQINQSENRERLSQLLEQKKRSVKGNTDYEIRQKLTRFALGRGFSFDEIETALREL